MALDSPGTGAPLFRRVADALADAIGRGDYPVGTRLPPEFTLGRMFGASRFTIREALVELRSSGLVASRRGSGTVVLRRAPQAPVFNESYQSIDAFLASVVEVPLQPLEIKDVIADDRWPRRCAASPAVSSCCSVACAARMIGQTSRRWRSQTPISTRPTAPSARGWPC
jgi:DNA-binding transcriptional regulator YhcF (GntR family)